MREINLHALLFADKIITENNGKKGIIGVFNIFNFDKYPVIAPPWFIFIQMDNLEPGKHEFTINLSHQVSQQVVFSGGGTFEIKENQEGAEIVFPMPPIQFRKDGNYIVSLIVDGRDIGQRIIKLIKQNIRG